MERVLLGAPLGRQQVLLFSKLADGFTRLDRHLFIPLCALAFLLVFL